MAALSHDIHLRELETWLKKYGKDAPALTFDKSLKEIQVYLSSQAKLSFDRQQSPDGTGWAPLKRQRSRPRDKRARGKRSTGQKVLRDTGILMASVSATAAAKGAIRERGRFHVEQGTSIGYAAYHQFGTKHMPARPFLGVTPKHVERMAQFVADDVVRQLGV